MSDFDGLSPASRSFFARDVLELAPALLGCVLQRTDGEGTISVRITEVEAYAGERDPGDQRVSRGCWLVETRYLVDNNVLNSLRRDHIRTAFFRDFCQVTTDVLWEAREHSEQAAVALHSRPHTAGLLVRVRDVMETLEPGDTRLIDLYGNKGTADPGLIASILEASDDDANKLLSDVWILVTNDHAVADKAAEFDLAVITLIELAKLIDGSLL